ncbi:Phytoene/squalene synthetase [Mycobacterium rhizamassiliense]|uniref:Phytoene/squalene synthetase n=1 Tax=Mycobacterium rhizamassiliense TaxID=1841860 RepID=A0A2U3NT93_9MYCO|nr:squalene synthase HpnC [Mycobacterium rhizamassiliense]SPM34645.1 Phytoene/squalene synthetase [Mycobacterium rhizamassiliense]
MRVNFLAHSDSIRGEPKQASETLRHRESGENFPVALRVLPKAVREDLHAIYAVARTIDDLGDAAPGDRVVALNDFRADLHRIWRDDTPRSRVLQALAPTVRAHNLDTEPFDRLIEANLIDQRVSRYETFEELIAYCRLSADPVGRLVLDVFDQCSSETAELSDRVCRALQLLEHWQDVAEDRRAGRVYLPQEDLATYGVRETDLDGTRATEALRELMMFEIGRAAKLLESGAPLVGRLTGWARIAVAGYVAGGRAAAQGLRRTGGDVLGRTPKARRRDVAFSAAALLLRAPTELTAQ